MAHYKKLRFLAMAIVLLICSIFLSYAFLYPPREIFAKTFSKEEAPAPVPAYIEHTVRGGETLWMIAGRYRSQCEDIRELIDKIYWVNGLETALIRPGQKLKIPVERR